jgi:hypothetical protein
MAKRGPASSYNPQYAAQARQLCKLGAINRELAQSFGVSERTIGNWLKQYADFKQAVLLGRLDADSCIAERLFERAKGYALPAVKIVEINGKLQELRYLQHLPPDTRACMFWLRNRRPQNWRDTAQPQHSLQRQAYVDRCLEALEAAGERARMARLRQSSG